MKLKLLLLTSICLLLSTAKVLAQDVDTTKKFNDYVISLKNDTIKCHIGHSFFGKLTYRVDGVRGARPLDPDSFKGFYQSEDSSFFVPRRLPKTDKLIFLRLLEGGKINLYELMQRSGRYLSFFWYASKNNDSLKLVFINSRKKWQQAFMDLIADNPALLDKYKEERKSTDYNYELIQFYVKLYNDGFLENQKTSK